MSIESLSTLKRELETIASEVRRVNARIDHLEEKFEKSSNYILGEIKTSKEIQATIEKNLYNIKKIVENVNESFQSMMTEITKKMTSEIVNLNKEIGERVNIIQNNLQVTKKELNDRLDTLTRSSEEIGSRIAELDDFIKGFSEHVYDEFRLLKKKLDNISKNSKEIYDRSMDIIKIIKELEDILIEKYLKILKKSSNILEEKLDNMDNRLISLIDSLERARVGISSDIDRLTDNIRNEFEELLKKIELILTEIDDLFASLEGARCELTTNLENLLFLVEEGNIGEISV
ncbi:MAG: hypothetical protein QXO55_05195 [Candidatus Korarchaeum sp.]